MRARAGTRTNANLGRRNAIGISSTTGDETKTIVAARRRKVNDEKAQGTRVRSGDDGKTRRARAFEGKQIKGFFERAATETYEAIDEVQSERFSMTLERTSMVEIGVYHGRSFLPLCALRNAGETVVAIDCFDEQEFNVDESGVGNYNKFVANVRRVCGAIADDDDGFWDGALDAKGELPNWIRVIKGDSRALRAEDIARAASDGEHDDMRSVRMFSIDGSHTCEATLSDLRLAEACLHRRGCVILDDVFNTDWPGCVSGLAAYLALPTSTLAPFAIAYNKVFLCAKDDGTRATYLSALEPKSRKTAEFFGHLVRVHKHGWTATFHANDEVF